MSKTATLNTPLFMKELSAGWFLFYSQYWKANTLHIQEFKILRAAQTERLFSCQRLPEHIPDSLSKISLYCHASPHGSHMAP